MWRNCLYFKRLFWYDEQYMKNLVELLSGVDVLEIKGEKAVNVAGLSISSKDVEVGALFCAIKGEKDDGHKYIDQAILNSAKIILCEDLPTEEKEGVTYLKVVDSKRALAKIASNFYDNPSEKFKLVGVTGTNGKTTIAFLLYSLFSKLGYKCGLISSIGDEVAGQKVKTTRLTPTTPDSISLNKLFAEMVEAGCEYVFMEVSSHALANERIEGVHFSGGIFTNLTHDHLDFHGTLENYRDAKKKFFDLLSPDVFALSNIDDPNGEYMLADTRAKKHFYGFIQKAEFNERLDIKLVGEFNMYNALAVYASATLLGQDKEKVKEILKNIFGVPGRFETVKNKNGITGIVDYAHTPDAVENVLNAIQKLPEIGKIITVIGCGGDRDKSKRPEMARIGYEMSDILIMTSDNPRIEKPEDILNDMRAGILNIDKNKLLVIVDRREAIQKACEIAEQGDVIALLGKGHENYQEINGTKNHFSDMEELKKFLEI